MQLLLKNALIVDPVSEIQQEGDLLIDNGVIAKVAKNIQPGVDASVLDLAGKVIAPGFIDIHVHLREPGYEDKETIATGTKAAAAGGFVAVVPMPNTNPPIDNEAAVEFVLAKARQVTMIDVLPCATITKGRAGKEIAEYGALKKAGAIALSDDGDPVSNPEVLRRAMEYSLIFDLPILAHSEDKDLAVGGSMHEGYYSTTLGLKGIPAIAEEVQVARDIALAEYTGARLHICHISTVGSVELVRRAKEKGLRVTAEAAPHHIALSDRDVIGYDTSTKVNPPLRSEKDVAAVIAGLMDGTIDAIASDHAPHAWEDKNREYDHAAFGISGIETSVAVAIDTLYHGQEMPLLDIIKRYTTGPRAVLGITSEGVIPGARADFTILDLNLVKRVDVEDFFSKGKNSPFQGKEFKGWPVMTICKGQIIHEAGLNEVGQCT